jgi:hypothetical protein
VISFLRVCRVHTKDPTHSQKGDHDDQAKSQEHVTPIPALTLTLALALALSLSLTLPPPPARPYRPMRSFSAAYARCP